MWKKLSIIGILLLLTTVSFSGCVEEQKQKLELSFDVDSTEFPVQMIVTSVECDKTYNWSKINISLVSQYKDPIYINRIGDIVLGDIIEIQESVFEDISKIDVRIRLEKSSALMWWETVYPPVIKPNITFNISESKMVVESMDKIDYSWDFNLTITNETLIITDDLYDEYKLVEIGDIIFLNKYEYYGEDFQVVLVYNPTGDVLINETVTITEADPELSITPEEISIDESTNLAYFYIHSGKTTFGTKMINWQITSDLPDWTTVTPMNGNFSYGKIKVNLSFSPTGLAAGTHNHIIKITSNYGNGELEVTLTKG